MNNKQVHNSAVKGEMINFLDTKFTCGNCGHIFMFDTFTATYDHNHEELGYHYTLNSEVVCPICGLLAEGFYVKGKN